MSTMKQKIEALPKPVKVAITVAGFADASLRAYALMDIGKRDATQIKGSKPVWIAALTTVNSLGVVPTAYLVWGRKR